MAVSPPRSLAGHRRAHTRMNKSRRAVQAPQLYAPGPRANSAFTSLSHKRRTPEQDEIERGAGKDLKIDAAQATASAWMDARARALVKGRRAARAELRLV